MSTIRVLYSIGSEGKHTGIVDITSSVCIRNLLTDHVLVMLLIVVLNIPPNMFLF